MIRIVFNAASSEVSRLMSLHDALFVFGGMAKAADWKIERAAAKSPVPW